MPYAFGIPKGMALAREGWTIIKNEAELKSFIAKKKLKLGVVKGGERVLFYKKDNPAYEPIEAEAFLAFVGKHSCYVACDENGFAKIFGFVPAKK